MTRFSNVTNPFQRSFQAWDEERKRRRDQYWMALYDARQEYMNHPDEDRNTDSFFYYLQRTYGFKPQITDDGKLGIDYTVHDEKKFLLFKIKYFK